ncbi:MAG: DUF1080 domain-containing protein [Phycisphaerales bacterium]|nr:MAG: DUF1080 domain-containing protein [Phycisphaerales bacterium]
MASNPGLLVCRKNCWLLTIAIAATFPLWAQAIPYYIFQAPSPFELHEDFDDGRFEGWKIVDEGDNYAPSSWSVDRGALTQTSKIFGRDAIALDMPGTYAFFQNGASWTDYTLSLTIKSEGDDAIGVMFRYQDNDNYYRLSWDRQRRCRRLVKKHAASYTLLAEDNASYITGRTYQLNILACGPIIQVYIDAKLIFQVCDSSVPSGSIALYSWANTASFFDNIVVERISASKMADDFEHGNLDDWKIVDDAAAQATSHWLIADGKLAQTSNIFDKYGIIVDMPGTYALYQHGATWTDYSVALDIKSDDDDAMGLMFRYSDNNNYYRFSWDSERRHRRLVKKQNGVFTLLAQDNVPYVTGRTYRLSVVACGPAIHVAIDDALIFCVRDSSLASGTIALYTWANAGGYFDNVKVNHVLPCSFTETFDDCLTWSSDWAIMDQGATGAPSVWSCAAGRIIQTSNIFGGDPDAIDMPGTYALYKNGLAWSNFRASLTISSYDNDAIGLMFRYQDDDNYYRFSWDRQRSYRRLVKKENGVFTLLTQDHIPYLSGRLYQLDIVACGPLLQVFIDGRLILSAEDNSFDSGTIALYNWANQGSCFHHLTVETPCDM